MLWRLVAKLLFKATLPLIALAGVFTYGIYMRGGDPAAFWKNVAGNGVGQFATLISGAKDDASQAVGALSLSGSEDVDTSTRTQVFTWQDAQGVTHYGTSAPEGINAQTLSVNPNVNVLAPVSAPPARQEETEDKPGSNEELAAEMGGSLPGVAGQVLSTRGSADASQGAVDPSQLIRLLQSSGN